MSAAWFEKMKDSPAGVILTDHYFQIVGTGGGCSAWQRDAEGEKHFAWITDESGVTLGEDVTDVASAEWCVGIYDKGMENFVCGYIVGLEAAIAWCEAALKLADPLSVKEPA